MKIYMLFLSSVVKGMALGLIMVSLWGNMSRRLVLVKREPRFPGLLQE